MDVMVLARMLVKVQIEGFKLSPALDKELCDTVNALFTCVRCRARMEGMTPTNMHLACEKWCPTCHDSTLGPVVGNTRSCPHCKNTWQLEDLAPDAPGIRVHGERV